MKKEIWTPIINYEGRYEISSYGRVKRVEYCEVQKNGIKRIRKEKILCIKKGKKGYCSIGLSKQCEHKFFLVHRLVAIAFLPNPQNLPCINHKDCNPVNNNVDNLEWCSYQYNSTYSDRIEKAVNSKCRKVCQYSKDGEYIATYRSAHYAAKQIGVAHQGVCLALKGKYKTYGGFIWVYE